MTARDVAVAGIDHLEGRHLAQLAHRRGILLQAIDEILLNPGLHVGSQAADARALADDRYAIVDGRRVFGEQGGQAGVAPWMTTHAALAMASGHRAQEENAAEGTIDRLNLQYLGCVLLDGTEITVPNPCYPRLQLAYLVLHQVQHQILFEARQTFASARIRVDRQSRQLGTDPQALRAIVPVVLVQIRRGYDHPHGAIAVAEEHHLGVRGGKRRGHLDTNGRDLLLELPNAKQLRRFVAVEHQKWLIPAS